MLSDCVLRTKKMTQIWGISHFLNVNRRHLSRTVLCVWCFAIGLTQNHNKQEGLSGEWLRKFGRVHLSECGPNLRLPGKGQMSMILNTRVNSVLPICLCRTQLLAHTHLCFLHLGQGAFPSNIWYVSKVYLFPTSPVPTYCIHQAVLPLAQRAQQIPQAKVRFIMDVINLNCISDLWQTLTWSKDIKEMTKHWARSNF